jgi:hypothetical protein
VQEVVYKHQELMCPGLYQPEVLWIEQTQLHGEMTMGHALLVLWGTAPNKKTRCDEHNKIVNLVSLSNRIYFDI